MASTRKTELKLSPRETRIVAALSAAKSWVDTKELALAEFGKEGDWPLHARSVVRSALNSANVKFLRNKSKVKILQRGDGGRGGVEYKIEGWRGNAATGS